MSSCLHMDPHSSATPPKYTHHFNFLITYKQRCFVQETLIITLSLLPFTVCFEGEKPILDITRNTCLTCICQQCLSCHSRRAKHERMCFLPPPLCFCVVSLKPVYMHVHRQILQLKYSQGERQRRNAVKMRLFQLSVG